MSMESSTTARPQNIREMMRDQSPRVYDGQTWGHWRFLAESGGETPEAWKSPFLTLDAEFAQQLNAANARENRVTNYKSGDTIPNPDYNRSMGLEYTLAYVKHPADRSPAILYYLDLDQIRTPSEMLDSIFQVPESYRSGADACDLLTAIHCIFNPQRFFCSFGQSHVAEPREVLAYHMGRFPAPKSRRMDVAHLPPASRKVM